jgi:hypothetical protein
VKTKYATPNESKASYGAGNCKIMEYKSQNVVCQNCSSDFIIEPDDFGFYEKIKVPPPTFCSECRQQRRFMWRNEKALYKSVCNLCNKKIISGYHPSVPFPVYCRDCWYGDGWDATIYGKEYDFTKSFFEQYKELSDKVPRLALFHRNAINSDYANLVVESKNVYLSISVTNNSENVFYSKFIDKSRDILDCFNVTNSSENLYQSIDTQGSYNSQYLFLSKNCIDSYFLYDCINCQNCFLSTNLRNKQYFILNEKYSKEEYFKKIEEFNQKSRISCVQLFEKFKEIKKEAIHRFSNIINCTNVSGNNVLNVRNGKNVFYVYDSENIKYFYRGFGLKDCMDFDYGLKSELMYEYCTGSLNDFNVRFSYSAIDSVTDSEYTEMCRNSSNLFGCISLHNNEYFIFNKKYSPEEFETIRVKIIEHMSSILFFDKCGNKYEYGEFFPPEISPWAYNETLAIDFFPLSREEAIKQGYKWADTDEKNFSITILPENIPDTIGGVGDEILDEVLGCAHAGKCIHQCSTAFKITPGEFQFYKKNNIPLPDKCSNCRYYERFVQVPLIKLYARNCMCQEENHGHNKKCSNEFQTPYSPDMPEKVYCESCYNKEIY